MEAAPFRWTETCKKIGSENVVQHYKQQSLNSSATCVRYKGHSKLVPPQRGKRTVRCPKTGVPMKAEVWATAKKARRNERKLFIATFINNNKNFLSSSIAVSLTSMMAQQPDIIAAV